MSVKDASKTRAAGQPAGDCIDCYQCVAVCPTGVDIRQGSQLGCIQCGLCIDACDAVMAKVHRPTRLISYDTDENMKRRQRGEAPVYRLARSRTIVYVAAIAFVGALMLYQLATRHRMGLSVLHVRAPMFTTARDGAVRNGYTLRFSNKSNETRTFAIEIGGIKDAVAKSEQADALPDGRLMVSVDPDSTQEIELYVTAPLASATNAGAPIVVKATDLQDGETVSESDHFFGP
jgi:cytochrome c oxidase accessory protein FixG